MKPHYFHHGGGLQRDKQCRPKASGWAQKEHLEDDPGLVIVSMTEVRGQSIQRKHGTYDAAVAEGVEDDNDLRSVIGFPEKTSLSQDTHREEAADGMLLLQKKTANQSIITFVNSLMLHPLSSVTTK